MAAQRRVRIARVFTLCLALISLAANARVRAAQSATPSTTCNALCAGIKDLIGQRQAAFESLKGEAHITLDDPPSWQAKSILPDAMNCRIMTDIGLQYMCLFTVEKAGFQVVLAAAIAAAPDAWVQRKVTGPDETTVYFGPTPAASALAVTAEAGGKGTIVTVNERDIPAETAECSHFCTAFKVALAERAFDYRGIKGAAVIKDSTESRLSLPGSIGGCQINTEQTPNEFLCIFPGGATDIVIAEMKKALPGWQFNEDRREGGFVRWFAKSSTTVDWAITLVALNDHTPVSIAVKSLAAMAHPAPPVPPPAPAVMPAPAPVAPAQQIFGVWQQCSGGGCTPFMTIANLGQAIKLTDHVRPFPISSLNWDGARTVRFRESGSICDLQFTFTLSADGRTMTGTQVILAPTPEQKKTLDAENKKKHRNSHVDAGATAAITLYRQ